MTFTPLERAALDGLAWELAVVAPDLAGQISESLPGQRRALGPIFLTETIVDRRRPNPPETTHGRLGTIHVQIDHLEHPIAFQAELVNGRLVALHGDAYGQDLSAMNLTGDVVDQVFMVMADGRVVPFHDRADATSREMALREASPLRKMQREPDPPDPFLPSADPTNLARRAGPAPSAHLDALFGPRVPENVPKTLSQHLFMAVTGAPPRSGPPLQPTEPTPEDLTSVRIGIVVLAVLIGLVLSVVMDVHPLFAAVPIFWITRGLLKKPVAQQIARALSARKA